MRHKWYFHGVDSRGGGPIEWRLSPDKAYAYNSRDAAQVQADLLNRGVHYITEDETGKKHHFHHFRVENAGENLFVICFDVNSFPN